MSQKSPKTPENTCIYAIGDVHGRLDLLDDILEKITSESQNEKNLHNILVMLGDYIDRGPNSFGVMNRLESLQKGHVLQDFDVHLLKGNHEEALLSFLAGTDPHTWLASGGVRTLVSYGLKPTKDLSSIRALFLERLPQAHRNILRSLKFSLSLGDYGFVHAGINPKRPWADQEPNDLLWIRDPFLNSKQEHELMIVHGHSTKDTPAIKSNRIGIDTKAWETGVLTCLVLEGLERRFIKSS